ncbi:MAG: FIST C-terminal domain-containing protein [Deltaproteobacteria bacterium]|nr:FIST C-terminal domain-containing protein [Deltaproteobacteria bacterium]
MKTAQVSVRTLDPAALAPLAELEPQLVLAFGAPAIFADPGFHPWLRAAFGDAQLAGCSTAGEISGDGVADGSVVVTAIRFARPDFKVASTDLASMSDSEAAGARLGAALASAELRDVWMLSQGVQVNGSALIAGVRAAAGPDVVISGGLAGDGGAFQKTYTLGSDGVSDKRVIAIGFGKGAQLSHGTFGGWQPFGPARLATRTSGNILHELDGEPALEVYKRYLGEYASGLPASGLLFPFALLGEDHGAIGLIRTILGVDPATGSLTFAGDIPQGSYLRLMHASTDALVDGAQAAARAAAQAGASEGGLTLLVSCVGRKLVMGGRIEEEIEAVSEVIPGTVAGFYSYGEISPFLSATDCRLHNQTMTITHLSEAA